MASENYDTVIDALGIPRRIPFVAPYGARPFVAKGGPIANTVTSYTAGLVIGAVNTIATGLPAGRIIQAATLRLKALPGDYTTQGALIAHIFDANPAGSTYTNNVAPTLVAADLAKFRTIITLTASAQAGVIAGAAAALPRMTVDANGNIYFVLIATASNVFATANSFYFDCDGLS